MSKLVFDVANRLVIRSSETRTMEAEVEGVHEYPLIHGIHTHIIKYGSLDEQRRLVLVIPGNPGAVEFYDEFMKTLHFSSKWPVWGLSHAGHSIVPRRVGWKSPDHSVFTVTGQIEHKLSFINKFVPDDVKIVLIGHSIGAHVVLEMLDILPSERVLEGMLLFPTIEKMAQSPQGRRLTPLLKNMKWLFMLIAACLWLLPYTLKCRMIDYVFDMRGRRFPGTIAPCIKQGAHSAIDPYCLSNTLHMANIEMQEVDEINEGLVRKHIDKTRYYYGATDHWCPKQHYYDMKERFPDHDKIELCSDGFRHAFIIDASRPMAAKVSEWLKLL